MHIFSPIDLKYTKLQKKSDNCSPAAPLVIKNFSWIKNINQERGGGQKYVFQIQYTPLGNN